MFDEIFILIPGRSTRQGTSLNEGKFCADYIDETNTLLMCPDDMKRLGFVNGERIRMRSEHGAIEIPCQAAKDGELPSGLLFMAYGDASSRLMGADTHGTGMPDSKGIDVRLEPILRGRELASAKLLEAIRKKKRVIVIATPGSEELRLLKFFNANANVGGEDLRHIILQEDARRIEVIEEFLHGVQMQIGFLDRHNDVDAEIHVKEFMIRHRRLLKLNDDDVRTLESMLSGK